MPTPAKSSGSSSEKKSPSTSSGGGGERAEHLISIIYDRLRAIAARKLERERPGHTLDATALVHEAYLQLADRDDLAVEGKTHFCALAARGLGQVLVDHARRRNALKRGGDRARISVGNDQALGDEDLDISELDEGLQALEEKSPQLRRVVELRFFGGLSIEETAAVMGVSGMTVKNYWAASKAILAKHLTKKN